MSIKKDDKIFPNKVESPESLWADFGMMISNFMKISRRNSRKAGLTLPQARTLR